MVKQTKKRHSGHAMHIEMLKADLSYTNTSKQLEEFEYNDCLQPPIEPRRLLEIVEQSETLGSIINIMATNIALHGYHIITRANVNVDNKNKAQMDAIQAEQQQLEEIFKYFNLTETFPQILYKAVVDYYSIGYATIEILRDNLGRIAGGEYAQAVNFRIASNTDHYAEVKLKRTVSGKPTTVIVPKRFRKFLQQISSGEMRYFKEFGDPRHLDYETGKYSEKPVAKEATEIMFLTSHNPANAYGMPCWTGCLVDILATRKASETNLDYFINGRMNPYAILVKGGMLSEASVESIKRNKGVNSANSIFLIEAFAEKADNQVFDGAMQDVDIKIQSLVEMNQKDAHFVTLQNNTDAKIAASFGIPPILRGKSSDYTRATATEARLITEEQVFKPMRDNISSNLNMVLEYELNLEYTEFSLKSPKIADYEVLAKTLTPFIDSGTISPNMLISTLSDILGIELSEYEDERANIPLVWANNVSPVSLSKSDYLEYVDAYITDG